MQKVDPTPVQALVGPLHTGHPQVGRVGVRLELDPGPIQARVHPVLAADLVPVPRVVPEKKKAFIDKIQFLNLATWMLCDVRVCVFGFVLKPLPIGSELDVDNSRVS